MDLRFLKGSWEFGRYKLQFRKSSTSKWEDVPMVEATIMDNPKPRKVAQSK